MNLLFVLLLSELYALHTPSYPRSPYWSASRYPYLRPTYPDGRRDLYPCHYTDRPTDEQLHCDSSPPQILFIPGGQNQTHAKQKENLIIIDIDQTILDSHYGADGPVFYQYAMYKEGITLKPIADKDLVLMCIQDPKPYSIVFRKGFFEFLHFVHEDVGFSADLMDYTRARHDHATNIVIGINAYYDKIYRDNLNHTFAPSDVHGL